MGEFKFVKGELVTLSNGEYSDYCVNGLVRVLKDFDASVLIKEWAKDNAVKINDRSLGYSREAYTINSNGMSFLGWLNKEGYTEDVEYRELHMGCYGEVVLS